MCWVPRFIVMLWGVVMEVAFLYVCWVSLCWMSRFYSYAVRCFMDVWWVSSYWMSWRHEHKDERQNLRFFARFLAIRYPLQLIRRDSLVNNPHRLVVDKRRVSFFGIGTLIFSLFYCIPYFLENEERIDSDGNFLLCSFAVLLLCSFAPLLLCSFAPLLLCSLAP